VTWPAVSRRPLTAEARVSVRVSPGDICNWYNGTGTGFSSSSVFPCQYNSTVTLHTHATWRIHKMSVGCRSSERESRSIDTNNMEAPRFFSNPNARPCHQEEQVLLNYITKHWRRMLLHITTLSNRLLPTGLVSTGNNSCEQKIQLKPHEQSRNRAASVSCIGPVTSHP
jgi:hypothetical protein